MGVRATLILMLIALSSCTQGHCRRKTESPELAAPSVQAAPVASADERVYVYKYDGSLQCGAGKAVTPEAMAKQLQGVTIFTMSKKRDGLIHIQVCGSITGVANVYEIPLRQLKNAESLGFKKWSFE